MVNGHVEIRDGLCLNTLRSVYDKQCTFAGGNRARHLVREVHVSRSVYQVEYVVFSVGRLVVHLNGMALDGDAALTLQIHIVEHLPLGDLNGLRLFQQAVGQRRLSMVDVGDDTKIPNVAYRVHLMIIHF